WAKKWPRTVTTAASPTAISSDCLAARDASWGSPAPVKRATSTVVPTVTAESAAMTRNMIWSAEPVPAIATAPSVPTIARTTTPSIVWNRFSAMIGMARPLTERTRWCSSRAKVFGRGRGGGRSGGAGASFGIVAIRAILADRGIVRRGRAGPGPRVVARRVPADPAHAGALGDAAAAAPQPDRHDRRRAADRADDAGGGDARQLQVTFKLRPGARWSDGQPVTARDVVFTWQLALNPTLGGAIDTERRLEKVEAPDDATAVFTFFSERSARAAAARQPNRYGFLRDQQGPVVDPLYAFGLPDWWVYPAHALGPLVDDAPATSPKAADALAKG